MQQAGGGEEAADAASAQQAAITVKSTTPVKGGGADAAAAVIAAAGGKNDRPLDVDDIMLEDKAVGASVIADADVAAVAGAGTEAGSEGTAGNADEDASTPAAGGDEAAAVAAVASPRAAGQQQEQPEQRAAGISGPRPTWGAPRNPFPAAGAPAVGSGGHAGGGVAAILGAGAGDATQAQLLPPSPGRSNSQQQRRQQQQPAAVHQSRWGAPTNPFPAAGQPSTLARAQQPQQQQGGRTDQGFASPRPRQADRAPDSPVANATGCFGLTVDDAGAPGTPAARADCVATPGRQRQREGCIDGADDGAEACSRGGDVATVSRSAAGAAATRRPAAAAAAAPLPLVLEVALTAPLLAQARLATAAAWRLIVFHYDLPAALRSLAHVYFQGGGDLADFLAASTEAMLARSGAPPGAAVAQAALEAAVAASSCAAHPLAQRVCLEVRPKRRVLPPGAAAGGGAGAGKAAAVAARRLEMGDILLLTYRAPWPLCLVITPDHMRQYADVFSALLRVRRASRRLHALWQRLSSRAGGGSARRCAGGPGGLAPERLRALRLWVHIASHCARALRAFLHEQLLGGITEALARRLMAAPMAVAEMRAAHDAMLAQARAICLLVDGGGDGGGGGDVGAPQQQEEGEEGRRREPEGQQQRQPPWAAGLSAEVHGLLGCCWRLQALAVDVTGGGSDDGGGSCSSDGWGEVEAAAGDMQGRLRRVRERLGVAMASEPYWQGLLTRLG